MQSPEHSEQGFAGTICVYERTYSAKKLKLFILVNELKFNAAYVFREKTFLTCHQMEHYL